MELVERPIENTPEDLCKASPPDTPKDVSRLVRLRDNKRRSRERQKQYIHELEQRCQEHREAGIQASIELQETARKVAAQNVRLRALLAALNVGQDVVERWVQGDDGVLGEVRAGKCGGGGKTACDGKDTTPPPPHDTGVTQIPSIISSPSSTSPSVETCKLLSQLKLNTSLDLRNLPDTGGSAPDSSNKDGVPCSQAYEMLIQHATTDEKLVDIAHILENGCTKSGSGGGCVVKNSAIWTALDRVCLQ
ncbi:hypothetical protein BDD12DRAFT_814995 [Trichophaea hybrida]|nr:hypothetical protein BDD12DRAFT_814995 [Trichophaea hybrida]